MQTNNLKELNNYLFKPLEEQDIPLLFDWQKQPHVSWWWQTEVEWPAFENKYKEYIAGDHVFPFIIYIKETPIGYIQYYSVDKLEDENIRQLFSDPKSVVGIDVFIGESQYIAAGHGTKCIKLFINKIFQNPEITTIIVDPRPENLLAINCFKKIGFEPFFEDNNNFSNLFLMKITKI